MKYDQDWLAWLIKTFFDQVSNRIMFFYLFEMWYVKKKGEKGRIILLIWEINVI